MNFEAFGQVPPTPDPLVQGSRGRRMDLTLSEKTVVAVSNDLAHENRHICCTNKSQYGAPVRILTTFHWRWHAGFWPLWPKGFVQLSLACCEV